jgi:hypothetical protein
MTVNLYSATNEPATAYHIADGPKVFAHKMDAYHAVADHPLEWSHAPWTSATIAAARAKMEARHAQEVEEATAQGLPMPPGLPPPPPPLDPEDEAALAEHTKAVADANERLKVARARAARQQAEEDRIAADEMLVVSPPPPLKSSSQA